MLRGQYLKFEWTRINNDVNGNGRWVCGWWEFAKTYKDGLAIAKKLRGDMVGRKFHNKQFGGGIAFCPMGGDAGLVKIEAALQEGGER